MDSNKVYKDIVYLLYNILDNEKLRYELYKDKNYRELYIELVDDLFTLEKDEKATFDDVTWATTFGKAIVVISQAKQRLEVKENKAVEKIYEDYSKMIAQSVNAFEVSRDVLTADKIKFTKADVLYNGRLGDDVIKKYDDLAKQETEAKTASDNAENMFVNDEDKKAKPEDEQQSNNQNYGQGGFGGFNPFGQGPSGQQFAGMPQNPMQDPRFYPFSTRPKWMPWAKIALGVIAVLTAILLIAASAWAMSKSIDLKTPANGANSILGWHLDPNAFPSGTKITDKDTIASLSNTSLGINQSNGSNAMNVIIYIFYCIPAIYVGYACFRKPRSLADKYRISYWPIIFMVVFYALSIIDTYQDASVNEIKNQFQSLVQGIVTKADYKQDVYNNWFSFWVHKDNLKGVTAFMDVAIAFLALSVISGIVLCFFNPKMDKMKYQKAMNEYQRAVMSAMQGIPYQMDQSLFEDDDNVIIHNKSKFTIWCEKIWDMIAFWKKKKNNRKDK